MSEKGAELDLSDEQREEVRKMLEQFSGKKEQQKKQIKARKKDQLQMEPDPLESAAPGETVEWSDLTPKTRRYPFVRESRGLFAPLILDKIPIDTEILNNKLKSTGAEITSQNESLTVCSITQADPIRVFQIQTKVIENTGGKVIIENIRYIV
tara:strand:+ start:537 stop:995 length:459 start_codon:yes stop_codon:yes gene_type:complete